MRSSLVGRARGGWIVESPGGAHFSVSNVNVVTDGVPAFIGMEGVLVALNGPGGTYRRFYARRTSETPMMALCR